MRANEFVNTILLAARKRNIDNGSKSHRIHPHRENKKGKPHASLGIIVALDADEIMRHPSKAPVQVRGGRPFHVLQEHNAREGGD